MAATVSAWAKPGAWALDSEENEVELLQEPKQDYVNNNSSGSDDKPDFPSLAAAAATKTKKKKPQTLSLQEFTTYKPSQRIAAKGLTHNELLALPTGPRQRSAEELDHNKIGGGFKNYGSLNERPSRDEHPRRQGSFNRDSSRESGLSRADETDNWASGKKLTVGNGFERRERGGFFSDSQSQADESDNWGSNKAFVPSEPRRYDRRGGFGLESNNGGADTDSWVKKKEEDGRKIGGAFDSLRERRGGVESDGADSEAWGRKREEGSGGIGSRPRLNLQPRTLPAGEGQKGENGVKSKGNPFGEARPREEVLIEKGQDWKEIEGKQGENGVRSKGNNPFGEARPREEVLIEKGQDWKEIEGQKGENGVKSKGNNPFGEARPREEVLMQKGQDWKEIEEKLETVKIKAVGTGSDDGHVVGKRSFWSENGREGLLQDDKSERTWRKSGSVDSRPQSVEGTENEPTEEAEDRG
ncbi:Uncharacterized protein Fot_46045 [Forsythia ovata]|uniref:Eukaryotic translation initiation factor 4B3-like n=1 Tax=Forsythia ovata TaxID=205694 RepID=A0ABD1QLX9_9LAMI